jgi:hypothetical protein
MHGRSEKNKLFRQRRNSASFKATSGFFVRMCEAQSLLRHSRLPSQSAALRLLADVPELVLRTGTRIQMLAIGLLGLRILELPPGDFGLGPTPLQQWTTRPA